jgi:hypothetical protein
VRVAVGVAVRLLDEKAIQARKARREMKTRRRQGSGLPRRGSMGATMAPVVRRGGFPTWPELRPASSDPAAHIRHTWLEAAQRRSEAQRRTPQAAQHAVAQGFGAAERRKEPIRISHPPSNARWTPVPAFAAKRDELRVTTTTALEVKTPSFEKEHAYYTRSGWLGGGNSRRLYPHETPTWEPECAPGLHSACEPRPIKLRRCTTPGVMIV